MDYITWMYPTVAQIKTNIPGILLRTEQSRNDDWVKLSEASVVSLVKTLSHHFIKPIDDYNELKAK